MIESHILFSTATFGLSPAGYLGSLLPDTFTVVKWLFHIPTGVKNAKKFLIHPQKYTEIIVGGRLRDLALICHSVFFLFPIVALGIYAYFHGLSDLMIFSLAWTYHVFTDYFTHKGKILPLFPVNRKWEFPYSVNFYDPSNFKLVVITDFLLLMLAIFRLTR